MKKCFITIAIAIAAAFTASAQELTDTPYFYTGYSRLKISMIDNFAYGFILPSASHINACGAQYIGSTNFGRNREFSFNLANIEYNLLPGGSVSLGLDLHWSNYRMVKSRYWEPYNYDCVQVSDPSGSYSSVKKSVLRVMSVDFPLDYTQHFGPAYFIIGVSGELNFPAVTRFKGVDNAGEAVKFRNSSITTEIFSANVHASFSLYGIGLYVKYRPVAQFTDTSGPLFTSWSAGILIR